MINSKYTSWLSSLTAVFTLAFASGVKAALIPAPTPTATYQLTGGGQPQPPFILDDISTAENAAISIFEIYINGVDPDPNIATVYNVCFEFGQYVNVFNANRTAANNNLPSCFTSSSQSTTPEFVGSSVLARLAAGGIDPSGASPPAVPIKSNGTLTPLNASFSTGGSEIHRVLANNVFDNGTPEEPNIVVNTVNTLVNTSFVVPYALENVGGTDYVVGAFVSFNNVTNTWTMDPMSMSASVIQEVIFARFQATGDTVNVRTPTPEELPEPSAIGGLVLVGAALWLTNRRR